MGKKNHYQRMEDSVTPGIILVAVIIVIVMLILKATR